jgi:signal transduction histidine kinase
LSRFRTLRVRLALIYAASVAALLLAFSVSVYGMLAMASSSANPELLSRARMTLMVGVPIAIVIAAGIGYWLACRALDTLQRITRTAAEIEEHDLSRRLDLGGDDEIGELSRTFDRMLDRLQNAFEQQRRFTSDASHQLRTPVAIVQLEVQRVLTQPRSTGEYRSALATIGQEIERMSRLISELLALARADAGDLSLDHARVDLSDLALEVVERMAPLAQARQVRLEVRELPEVMVGGDRAQLALLLSNLIDNGLKYTAGVGTYVRVSTGCENTFGWARVEDDGPGIDSAHMPHVFEAFYRVANPDGEQSSDGHGLGLSIARAIAGAHGGEVVAETPTFGGVRFTLRLPR